MLDSHAHPQLFEDPFAEINEAIESGVSNFFCISTSINDYEILKKIKNKYETRIKIALGEHPLNELEKVSDEKYDYLQKLAADNYIDAIGELGFDSKGDYNLQIESFDKQAYIATRHHLPIVLHTRNSEEITIRKLNENNGLYGIFHCFTGSLKMLEYALTRDWLISIAGLCTYKKNIEYFKEILDIIPLNKLLLETDAPYLSPEPLRGQRNHIKNIEHTYKFVAKCLNIPVEHLSSSVQENYNQLFNYAKIDYLI